MCRGFIMGTAGDESGPPVGHMITALNDSLPRGSVYSWFLVQGNSLDG